MSNNGTWTQPQDGGFDHENGNREKLDGVNHDGILNEDDIESAGEFEYEDETLIFQQMQLENLQSQAAANVPDVVKKFIGFFHQSFTNNDVSNLRNCYEVSFNKLSEKFYKNSPWPDPISVVSPLVGGDQLFVTFYTEVYYRHLYAKLSPTLEQRLDSFNNYMKLFNEILSSSEPLELDIPTNWCWDIIDEFIYQYNSFCVYRQRIISNENSDSELEALREQEGVWNYFDVLNVLYSVVNKSQILEQLRAIKNSEDPDKVAGEWGIIPFYKTLGYFSIIGLLRVQTLMGDFTLALKTMEDIELNKKALFSRVTAAHFTAYYYVGYSYFMLRRYADAIKAFSHILLYISRTKNLHRRSVQFDLVTKKSEQMYALLAICVTLSPMRLDESLHSVLREKYADQLGKMSSGSPDTALPVFAELFKFASPKFINPVSPDYTGNVHGRYATDPLTHHLEVFLTEVRNVVLVPTMRSYLKLYSTMHINKLASFLGITPEALRETLVVFKEKTTRQIKWTEGSLLDGQVTVSTDLDIYVENDVVHISESKGGRKFADWFIRNTYKNFGVQENILQAVERQLDSKV